jgi:hypothetical protein
VPGSLSRTAKKIRDYKWCGLPVKIPVRIPRILLHWSIYCFIQVLRLNNQLLTDWAPSFSKFPWCGYRLTVYRSRETNYRPLARLWVQSCF